MRRTRDRDHRHSSTPGSLTPVRRAAAARRGADAAPGVRPDGSPIRRRHRAAHGRRAADADLEPVPRPGRRRRRGARRSRRAPRRQRRADVGQPAGVLRRRHRRPVPRRRPVLGVQHLLRRAGRLPVLRCGQPGRRHRAAVPPGRPGGAGARRLRRAHRGDRRGRRRRDPDPRRSGRGRTRGFRPRRGERPGRAGRRGDADLHLGHHRAAQGRRADPRQPGGAVEHAGAHLADQAGRPGRVLPARRAHRRPARSASTWPTTSATPSPAVRTRPGWPRPSPSAGRRSSSRCPGCGRSSRPR